MDKTNSLLRKWELALLLALCVTLCGALWLRSEQNELSEKLIRLHVVARSDDPDQQSLKLAVRDRVLELVEPVLDQAQSRTQAEASINELLPQLETEAMDLARERGQSCAVTASLSLENYPTREYEHFSLPAGEYMSLRLVLGEGQGENWWCVVFPPLCVSAAGSPGPVNGLDDRDIALITEDGEGYVLKFKLFELLDSIKNFVF